MNPRDAVTTSDPESTSEEPAATAPAAELSPNVAVPPARPEPVAVPPQAPVHAGPSIVETQPMAPYGGVYPPPTGGPYRLPETEIAFVSKRRPWPVLGPSLSVFAVLLWSFVVAGQFTTSFSMGRPLGQGVAVAMVLAATSAAAIAHLRRSGRVVPPTSTGRLLLRALAVGFLSFVLFLASLVFAIIVGQATRGLDLFVAFVLVAIATLAALVGPRLTAPVPLERTHRARVTLVVLWIGGAILTLVAAVDLGVNG